MLIVSCEKKLHAVQNGENGWGGQKEDLNYGVPVELNCLMGLWSTFCFAQGGSTEGDLNEHFKNHDLNHQEEKGPIEIMLI